MRILNCKAILAMTFRKSFVLLKREVGVLEVCCVMFSILKKSRVYSLFKIIFDCDLQKQTKTWCISGKSFFWGVKKKFCGALKTRPGFGVFQNSKLRFWASPKIKTKDLRGFGSKYRQSVFLKISGVIVLTKAFGLSMVVL